MNLSTASLIQSRYFSPVFNTAIFDGPVRIYFAQAQEPEALKVYGRIREMVLGDQEPKIFVLLYPNRDCFAQTFPTGQDIQSNRLGEDFIVAICGPLGDEQIPAVLEAVRDAVSESSIGIPV